MSTNIVISKNDKRSRGTAGTPATTSTVVVRPTTRRRRRRNRQGIQNPSRNPKGLKGSLLRMYASTLNDPFHHRGLPLGFDTTEDHPLTTAYLRMQFPVASDGSFAAFCTPQVHYNGFLTFNNTSYGSLVWTGRNASDWGEIVNNYSAVKVVSGGMRVIPSVPGTGKAGSIAWGCMQGTVTENITTLLTPGDLWGSPQAIIGSGKDGCTVLWRPTDSRSYDFDYKLISNAAYTGGTLPGTVPFVAGTGFDAATTITIEVIFNYEAQMKTTQYSAINSNPPQTAAKIGVADAFSSVNELLKSVKPHIIPCGFDGITSSKVDILFEQSRQLGVNRPFNPMSSAAAASYSSPFPWRVNSGFLQNLANFVD